MKNLKKILALVMVVAMMAALGVCAFAQTEPATTTDADNASIVINNASKGETYTVYQLFDATVTGTANGSIAYQLMSGKAVPSTDYFTVDDSGNVHPVDGLDASTAGFKTWATGYGVQRATAVSDGSTLTFTGLPYGYYYVASTQGATITVTSTNPSASITDKNSTPPLVVPSKVVNDTNVYIGETVTYTLKVSTANYDGTDLITNYYIKDVLPDFLTLNASSVTVSISTEDVAVANNAAVTLPTSQSTATYAFDSTGVMTIAWTNTDETQSLYTNGSYIYVQYTATVNDNIAVGSSANTNTMQYTYSVKGGDGPKPYSETFKGSTDIYTYAAAIQKYTTTSGGADGEKINLAGAKFAINGLTVKGSAGKYEVVSYDATSTTPGTEMECDANGLLVIAGLPSDVTLTATETEAPKGYNKLVDTVSVTPYLTSGTTTSTITTVYYDADGNVVSTEAASSSATYAVDNSVVSPAYAYNAKGDTLPSTGGMGTTIFYVIGGIMVLGAGILLVTKKRMAANG